MNQNISFKEWLQPLEVGSHVYTFKPYRDGVVIMEVLSISPDASTVELKSVNTHGYHYWLTEDKFKIIQKRGPRAQHYYTEQSAIEAHEDFIKEMVKKAYESEADPEYGDYVIAKAIEDVAKYLNIDIKY